jgi:hypothetical protein
MGRLQQLLRLRTRRLVDVAGAADAAADAAVRASSTLSSWADKPAM